MRLQKGERLSVNTYRASGTFDCIEQNLTALIRRRCSEG